MKPFVTFVALLASAGSAVAAIPADPLPPRDIVRAALTQVAAPLATVSVRHLKTAPDTAAAVLGPVLPKN